MRLMKREFLRYNLQSIRVSLMNEVNSRLIKSLGIRPSEFRRLKA